MPDGLRVATHESWTSRLSGSIKGVVFGVVLFMAGFPLLFWNEGRAVRTATSLEEGAGIVVSVPADVVDPANEGRLVHVSGFTKTDEVLRDDRFGVEANAIRLSRDVEMYQWVQTESSTSETKLGGGKETTTTYAYSTEWRPSLVDSSAFQSPDGHRNPGAFPFETRTLTAQEVKLGAFTLSDSQVSRLHHSEPLRLEALPSGLEIEGACLQDGGLYIGEDPSRPAVGDVKVCFRVVRPGAVSIVAEQRGSSFAPYRAEAGASVFLLEEAVVRADAMFESAQRSNTAMTWFVRIAGFFVMFFGLSLVFRPIAVFGDVVPLVGKLLGAGVGLFSALVAAFFAVGTIALAWIVYRPLFGVVLLALALGAVFLLSRIARKQSAAVVPPPLPPVEAG